MFPNEGHLKRRASQNASQRPGTRVPSLACGRRERSQRWRAALDIAAHSSLPCRPGEGRAEGQESSPPDCARVARKSSRLKFTTNGAKPWHLQLKLSKQ